MNTVAVIQARMGSIRLPGKVLADVCGRPMLERMLERLSLCQTIDELWVATSTNLVDDEIVDFCANQGVQCFAGHPENVLSRYWQVANLSNADIVVRLTGDCPLIDASIVDRVVDQLRNNQSGDYACNFFPNRRYPRGLDAEAFTFDALKRVNQLAKEIRHREHVTLMMYENPRDFHILGIENPKDHSRLRWTVDTPADLKLVREIYEYFGEQRFGWHDVIAAYRQRPKWHEINESIRQKVA